MTYTRRGVTVFTDPTNPALTNIPDPLIVNPMSAPGDLIVGGYDGTPIRLPVGLAGQVLTVVNGILTWTTPGAVGINPTPTPVQTANYTLSAADSGGVVSFDATAGPLTASLPAASSVSPDLIFRVKKIDSTTNTVTVMAHAGDTINGDATLIISSRYSVAALESDTVAGWSII